MTIFRWCGLKARNGTVLSVALLLFLVGCDGVGPAALTRDFPSNMRVTATVTSAPQGCSPATTTAAPIIDEATGRRSISFVFARAALMGNGPSAPLAFSPDGRWLALGTAQGVTLYDGRTLDPRLVCPYSLGAISLAFAPGGAALTAGGLDTAVVTWRLPDGALSSVAQLPSPGTPVIVYAPDGATFAVADSRHVTLFRPGQVHPIWTVDAPRGTIADMVFAADGQTIVIADTGNLDPHQFTAMATRWLRAADGATLERREGPVTFHAALSLNTNLLARWGGSDAAPELVALNSTATTPLYKIYPVIRVTALDFMFGGSVLGVGDEGGAVTLFDTRNGQPIRRVMIHPSAVINLADSPDGSALATVSAGGTVSLGPLAQWR